MTAGGARPADSRRPLRGSRRPPGLSTWQTSLLLLALVGLVAGGILHVSNAPGASQAIWGITTAAVLASTLVSAIRKLSRGEAGVDLIAILAMTGSLVLGQALAGVIIGVMLTGGAALERFAASRARRDLAALLERAPRMAHRVVGERVVGVPVEEVKKGDILLVKPGEVVPADGVLTSAAAVFDESALTGESRPVNLERHAPIRSGATNAGGPVEFRVKASAAESTYAGIIRLVEAAEESKAPFVRLADRYASFFLVLTLVLAGAAWMISLDPVRALAVLVVATPCPLILAAPAAIIAGVSRAARHGIIMKGGGALETLGRASLLLLDKTGTVTAGRPSVVAVESFGSLSHDEIVRLAASVEQVSVHPFAPAILLEARTRGLELRFPLDAREEMGTGIQGDIDGERVSVGQLGWVAPGAEQTPALRSVAVRTEVEGSSAVYVSVGGRVEGAILLQDLIRGEAPRVLRELRKVGFTRIHMVTGDHPDVAELVGDAVGFDRVFAERTPEEKVEVVNLLRQEGVTAMVGDGVNDAPALALADVGVAMGARGASAASEAADIVLTLDRLEGLVLASRIATRTRRIALESVLVGMGLSIVAMIAAAWGLITPVAGALLQEGIDVLVIVNALRALAGGGLRKRRTDEHRSLARKLETEHRELWPHVSALASLAGSLETLEPAVARRELEKIQDILEEELLPHEREEQESAYPVIGKMMRHEDPTGPLVETHHEIHRLARLYGRLVERLPKEGPGRDDLRDLRRVLYGLHAVLSLHFAQEEEVYSLLEG